MSAPAQYSTQQLVDDPSLLYGPPEQGGLARGGAPTLVTAYGDHTAEEIGAAVLLCALLARHRLQSQALDAHDPHGQAVSAWDRVAPMWMRLMVPAVKQAFVLGQVKGLSDVELNALAADYARGLGGYVGESSAEAFAASIDNQFARKWSPDLAMHRAAAAYGLDRQQMGGYLAALARGEERPTQLVPLAARAFVDKAMLVRAERIGRDQSYSAQQTGQALAWAYLAGAGRLPAASLRGWELGGSEQHCATCASLAEQQVPVTEPFVLASGAKLWAPRAHPGCTCRVRLRTPASLAKRKVAGCLTRPGSAKILRPARTGVPTVAGLAVLAQDTGRVLMLQRAQDPKDPAGGMWEFPGGHLEREESPLDGGRREWEEEVRRRLPAGRVVGSWRHGIYEGFVLEVPDESVVPSHSRGRVANPDDPDGDQVEAIAWWDPAHLAGNPAVRPELRDSLPKLRRALKGLVAKSWEDEPRDDDGKWIVRPEQPVAKAYDPKERRDPRGRWADTTFAEPEQDVKSKPVSPFTQEPTVNPFTGAGAVFSGVPSAFSQPPSPFTRQVEGITAFRGASPFALKAERPRRVVHRSATLIQLQNDFRPPPAPAGGTFYLPVSQYNEALGRDRNDHYDKGVDVDFTNLPTLEALQTPRPWALLDDSDYFFPYASSYLDGSEVHDLWEGMVKPAQLLHNAALTDPESIVEKLTPADLNRIYSLADWSEGRASPDRQRRAILQAVAGMDEGDDDSLAHAYGDYVTWTDPKRFFGADGLELQNAIDRAESAGISLFDSEYPLPVQQVFGIEGIHHPATYVDKGSAFLSGKHAAMYHRYRSALHDYHNDVVPPMRLGLRETMLVPFQPKG